VGFSRRDQLADDGNDVGAGDGRGKVGDGAHGVLNFKLVIAEEIWRVEASEVELLVVEVEVAVLGRDEAGARRRVAAVARRRQAGMLGRGYGQGHFAKIEVFLGVGSERSRRNTAAEGNRIVKGTNVVKSVRVVGGSTRTEAAREGNRTLETRKITPVRSPRGSFSLRIRSDGKDVRQFRDEKSGKACGSMQQCCGLHLGRASFECTSRQVAESRNDADDQQFDQWAMAWQWERVARLWSDHRSENVRAVQFRCIASRRERVGKANRTPHGGVKSTSPNRHRGIASTTNSVDTSLTTVSFR
jgi:hypothetical protein